MHRIHLINPLTSADAVSRLLPAYPLLLASALSRTNLPWRLASLSLQSWFLNSTSPRFQLSGGGRWRRGGQLASAGPSGGVRAEPRRAAQRRASVAVALQRQWRRHGRTLTAVPSHQCPAQRPRARSRTSQQCRRLAGSLQGCRLESTIC